MREVGIYIHIPFCKKKCKYCDFLSFENNEYVKEYVDRVVWEIKEYKGILYKNNIENDFNDIVIDTIYIGGGTPSFIESKYIVQILNTLKENFVIKNNPEITIEINPGTVDKNKLQDYYSSGINRLSMGLQETHDEILKNIGRIHNFDKFLNTYKLARELRFNNINIDLMIGLPNQTLAYIEESLNKILTLSPNHISLYSLILEEGTLLEKEVKTGKFTLPSEELERKMYHKSKEILEKNNYIHYEISNFAKKGFYSKHNLNCWEQHEYLGFGLGSHSYFNKKRFSNQTNFQKYIEKSGEQVYNNSVMVHEVQSSIDQMKEYMLLGFRKINGIKKIDFYKKFKIDINKIFFHEITKLKNEGLIEENNIFIKPTLKGLDLANIIFEEFI